MVQILFVWKQQIRSIDRSRSSQKILEWGIPQGYVLGQLLLIALYISPIEDIIEAHGLQSASYANDNQICFSIRPSDRCTKNMHKSNPNKTDFIYFSSKLKPCSRIPNLSIEGH